MTVRPLRSTADFARCVEAQRTIWGSDFAEVVPGSLLQITRKVGGVAAGAFVEPDALMAGFVYGLTGVRRGRIVHWSHMLGVLPDYRRRGIGRKLKHYQRRRLLERGVEEMLWTFDPLFADNAHFNLNLLGVEIDSYEADMYGETGSDLHAFGTDRLVVRWRLSEEKRPEVRGGSAGGRAPDRPEGSSAEEGALAETPLANPFPPSGDAPDVDPEVIGAPRVRVEIPRDILRILREDPRSARAWRTSTRAAFQRLFGDGYRVTAFVRRPEPGRGVYLMEKEPDESCPERDDA